jgi:hypothetical protein
MSHVQCPNCGLTVAARGAAVPVCERCVRRRQGRHLMTLVQSPHLMRQRPTASTIVRE